MMSEARDDVGCHCCKVVQIHGFTEIESSKIFVWVGGLMKCVSYFTYGIVCAVYSYEGCSCTPLASYERPKPSLHPDSHFNFSASCEERKTRRDTLAIQVSGLSEGFGFTGSQAESRIAGVSI